MSYQSPIELIYTQMQNQIDSKICKTVMNVGVNVDKEELIKALQYDREQYWKGYKDRDDQIVRCKYCKYHDEKDGKNFCDCGNRPDDWFCAGGERKD